MNIMISINREFIPCACVMLMSLKEHHADTELSVYVLHHELTQQDFLEMDQVIGPDGIALIPVYIPEGTVRDFQMGKWPEEAAYRLLATDLFARDMDRILHLDTDMLITGSLLDFYNTSFDGNYLVACEDFMSKEQRKKKCRDFAKDEDALFFNSGVLLFNLSKLAEDGFYYAVYADILQKYSAIRIEFPDQDMLNLLFGGKTKYMDRIRYNYAPYYYRIYDGDHYYDTREQLSGNCNVLHMIWMSKPWESPVRMEANELWWEYAERTPYYETMKRRHVQKMLEQEQKMNDMIRDKADRITSEPSDGQLTESVSRAQLLDEICRREQRFEDRLKKIKKI